MPLWHCKAGQEAEQPPGVGQQWPGCLLVWNDGTAPSHSQPTRKACCCSADSTPVQEQPLPLQPGRLHRRTAAALLSRSRSAPPPCAAYAARRCAACGRSSWTAVSSPLPSPPQAPLLLRTSWSPPPLPLLARVSSSAPPAAPGSASRGTPSSSARPRSVSRTSQPASPAGRSRPPARSCRAGVRVYVVWGVWGVGGEGPPRRRRAAAWCPDWAWAASEGAAAKAPAKLQAFPALCAPLQHSQPLEAGRPWWPPLSRPHLHLQAPTWNASGSRSASCRKERPTSWYTKAAS